MTQAYRDLQARIMNPTHLEGYAEEVCDRCQVNDLGDTAVKVKDPRYPGIPSYYCEDCAETVERCDVCHLFRCDCP